MRTLKLYHWAIIIAVGIILFSMPCWYSKLLLGSSTKLEDQVIMNNHQNISQVDYTVPNNLKIRHISVSDITNTNQSDSKMPSGTGVATYRTSSILETQQLLDSLKEKRTNLTIDLTLNVKKDSLSRDDKLRLKQKVIDMIGYENIQKTMYVEIKIFKETNYTIKFNTEYPLEIHDENLVLLEHINFYSGGLSPK